MLEKVESNKTMPTLLLQPIFPFQNFGWNLTGAVCIIAWTAANCIIMFGSMKVFGVLRVSEEVEIAGMDRLKHGEPAYPLGSYEEPGNPLGCDKRLPGRSTGMLKCLPHTTFVIKKKSSNSQEATVIKRLSGV